MIDVGRLDSVEALYIHTAAHHAPTATVPNARCPMPYVGMWVYVGVCGNVEYGYVEYVEYAVYVAVAVAVAVLQLGRNAVSPRPVGSVHAEGRKQADREGGGAGAEQGLDRLADRSECCPECCVGDRRVEE